MRSETKRITQDADDSTSRSHQVFAFQNLRAAFHLNPEAPMTQSLTPSTDRQPLLVGIDWADQQHAVCILAADGTAQLQTLPQDPDSITQWAHSLKQNATGPILIALEQSRGALLHALLEHQELQLYPLNPKQLARFREAIYPSGGKSDPADAELIARFLQHHRQQLRPYRLDSEQTRRIALLAETRRHLVEDRKRLVQRLTDALKQYFPLFLKLFGKRLAQDLVLELLQKWPTLAQLKRPHPKTLRTFFAKHGVRNAEQQTEWINSIRSATPLTRDPALIEPYALLVQALGRQIAELNTSIAQFEEQLAQAVAQHPDAPLFRSVPGAGDALVPRLIAGFGSDRQRYASAEALATYTGIAPIIRQSGKARLVLRRVACPKFLRQTFHELADQTRKWSSWSKAFYAMKRAAGMAHHAAVRALAFKWIRILFQLWQTGSTYSETRYLDQLKKKNSPLLKYLETT
jgi:transposase